MTTVPKMTAFTASGLLRNMIFGGTIKPASSKAVKKAIGIMTTMMVKTI